MLIYSRYRNPKGAEKINDFDMIIFMLMTVLFPIVITLVVYIRYFEPYNYNKLSVLSIVSYFYVKLWKEFE